MKHYALVGNPLSHSLSPVIHRRLMEHLGISGTYSLFEVQKENLPGLFPALRVLGVSGVSVTIPYKRDVMAQLTGLDEHAAAIGAVNTIALLEDGGAVGYNTDYYGFREMLRHYGIETQGARAVVLGTGGAAQAVIAVLRDGGARSLTLVSRRPDSEFPLREGERAAGYGDIPGGDLLINTTPVGMYPNGGVSPVPESVVARFSAVADLVYRPRETELLRIARLLNKRTAPGLFMLVAQAKAAQEIWQSRAIPGDVTDSICKELSEGGMDVE